MSAPEHPAPVLHFLNRVEAQTLDAMAGRILPGSETDPGASEAEAVIYIDRALAGFLRDQQSPYRVGLRRLDGFCREEHGSSFRELTEQAQDDVLAELDRRATSDDSDPLGHLFDVVREHVVQGTFGDPTHGGNRDAVGWRLVGFPGARWGYGAQEMARDFDADTIPLTTLADLYAGDRSIGR